MCWKDGKVKKSDNKVAIFTFIKANNYGAMLQAYALGKFLKENGYAPVYIDVDLKKRTSSLKAWLRGLIINLRFNSFRKKYFSLVPITRAPNYGTFIYGSDQIWNADIVNEKLEAFSGGLVPPKSKKIAYAASFGVETIEVDKYHDFGNRLSNFSSILIRENSGVTLLKEEFTLDSEQVLDPTFLIDGYDSLSKNTSQQGVVCYLFGEQNRDYAALDKFSTLANETLYFLNQTKSPVGKAIPFPTVETWLSSITNAKYVVTDSFHCMVLALLHGVNFFVVSARADRFTRITSLLEALGLENRILGSISELASPNFENSAIDFSSLNERLEPLRNQSRSLLLDSLKKGN
jgi:hypothetical protein